MDFDVVVVGAGHNALVSAAYVAQAGYRVGVFERRSIVGGAVATQELVPGYRFDLGGSAHILIRLTPIVDELGLARFGLEYLELDPLFFAPYPDGDAVFIYRDVDRTAHELEAKFPGEGEAYRRLIDDWSGFSQTIRDVFLSTPSPLNLGRKMAFGRGPSIEWKRALGMIMRPYGEVVSDYFKEEKIKAPLTWMAAQSGPPPTEPITGPFVLWQPLYHEGGIARPRGGSGMLTQALRRHIEHHGGSVFTDTPIDEILIENRRAVGVRSGSTLATARAVLAGTHIAETLNKLLPAEHRPSHAGNLRIGNGFGAILRLALDGPVQYAAHPRAGNLRIGNGFGAILRLALDGPVQYAAHPGREARVGLQLICRDTRQLHAAYGDYLRGRPATDPPLVAMTFSAVDSTLAPPGHEVLWLWAQYYPYEMADGARWSDVEDRVADQILDAFEAYAPGTRDRVVGRLFQHPEWLERHLGLFRGNVMHLEMSMDQMFMLRPLLGLASYRAHLPGLYLTGASTHPGGGIMGASGRNAARVLLKDLSRKKWWVLQ